MDIEFKGTEQLTKLRAIENEVSRIHAALIVLNTKFVSHISQLKELYPEIFASEESKKRLYFATRLVLHLHANRRSKFKKRDEENPAAPTRRSPIITHKQKENQQSVVATQDLACESASHTLPRLKEFPMDIDPDVTCTIHDPKRYRDIHNFLEASMPPMTHLMDAFIDFGCINADFLLTISSWSIEKIRDVLDQLSPGSNGKQITEMDKFILEYHFKEYFTQKGRRGNKSDL